MTAITSLMINRQKFDYASAHYKVLFNGAKVQSSTYLIISFDTEDKTQAKNYEMLLNHNKKEFVAIAVNETDETGYIEEFLNDPVGVIRIRFQ